MIRIRANPVRPSGGTSSVVIRLPDIPAADESGGESAGVAGLYVERYTRPDGRCYALFYLTGIEPETVTLTYDQPSGVSAREISDTLLELSTSSYTDPLSVTLTHAGIDYTTETTICA